MRYVNPDESPPAAYSVLSVKAHFYKPEKGKKDKKDRKRWCLYGVRKGMPAVESHLEKYDVVDINDAFFDQLKLTNQVCKRVVDRKGQQLDRLKFIEEFWPDQSDELSKPWESFPDNLF